MLEGPGVTGIILDPKGKLEMNFVWDLGEATNNRVEANAKLHGLFITLESGIESLIVIRDSSTIIKLMRTKSPSPDSKIASTIAHSQKEANNFQKYLFYLVLREHNHSVD